MLDTRQRGLSPFLLIALGFTFGVVTVLGIFGAISWYRGWVALFDERCQYQCPGPYPACVGVSNGKVTVLVKNISRGGLDSYDEWRPLTGGDRLFVYFDIDPDQMGAEYRLVIYRDEWTFRGPQRDEDGYEIELASGTVKPYGHLDHMGAEIEFDASHLDGEVSSAWNYRM